MATENRLSLPKNGLLLIGMGPGEISSMTTAAKEAAASADYRRYEAYTALWPDNELTNFCNNSKIPESVCNMCTARPLKFSAALQEKTKRKAITT